MYVCLVSSDLLLLLPEDDLSTTRRHHCIDVNRWVGFWGHLIIIFIEISISDTRRTIQWNAARKTYWMLLLKLMWKMDIDYITFTLSSCILWLYLPFSSKLVWWLSTPNMDLYVHILNRIHAAPAAEHTESFTLYLLGEFIANNFKLHLVWNCFHVFIATKWCIVIQVLIGFDKITATMEVWNSQRIQFSLL